MDASPLKRLFEVGMKRAWRRSTGASAPAGRPAAVPRAARPARLHQLSSAATGGAALGPDTFRFFLAMGVPLRQLYGQTELLGAYTVHRPDDVNFDTVGVRFDETIEMASTSPTTTASARS